MDIDELLLSLDKKGMPYNINSLLLVLLQKTIQNESKLDHISFMLCDISAKLDGKEGSELDALSTQKLKAFCESVDEVYKKEYLRVMNTILD